MLNCITFWVCITILHFIYITEEWNITKPFEIETPDFCRVFEIMFINYEILKKVTDSLDSVLCSNIWNCVFLHWIKAETQSYKMVYHTLHLKEQWESNSALKVDQLWENGLWMFWYLLESFSLSTPIQHCPYPLKL